MADEKKTEAVKVHLSESLLNELSRLCAIEDRRLSDYIGRVLRRHCWGHAVRLPDENNHHQEGEE